jgi:cell division protein FtsL
MKKEKIYKRKISIFNFLICLAVTAVLLVFYISNIIYINRLSAENVELKSEINKAKQTNDLLSTEVEKLSSYERIKNLAYEKFALSLRHEAISENKKIVLNYPALKQN